MKTSSIHFRTHTTTKCLRLSPPKHRGKATNTWEEHSPPSPAYITSLQGMASPKHAHTSFSFVVLVSCTDVNSLQTSHFPYTIWWTALLLELFFTSVISKSLSLFLLSPTVLTITVFSYFSYLAYKWILLIIYCCYHQACFCNITHSHLLFN